MVTPLGDWEHIKCFQWGCQKQKLPNSIEVSCKYIEVWKPENSMNNIFTAEKLETENLERQNIQEHNFREGKFQACLKIQEWKFKDLNF